MRRERERESEAEHTVYVYSCGCRESEVANINSENSRFTWIIDVRTRNACTYSCNLYVYMNWRKGRCSVASRVCMCRGGRMRRENVLSALAKQRCIIWLVCGQRGDGGVVETRDKILNSDYSLPGESKWTWNMQKRISDRLSSTYSTTANIAARCTEDWPAAAIMF